MVKTVRLYQPRREVVARPREHRESRHNRGYDHEWTKIASRHAKQFPVCQECERSDIIVPVDVVDHKIPIRCRPELRLDPKNLWSLCHFCHQGIKKRMEAYAERAKMVDLLILWCDEPETRPEALKQASRRRKVKEEMIV